MAWPLSQDYNEAIQNPAHLLRRPRAETGRGRHATPWACRSPAPATSPMSTPSRAGQREVGGQVLHPANPRSAGALRPDQPVPEAGAAALHGGFLLPGTGHPGTRQWYPVLKMQWVEGFKLNTFVRTTSTSRRSCRSLCARSGCGWRGDYARRTWRTATCSTATSCSCRAARQDRWA